MFLKNFFGHNNKEAGKPVNYLVYAISEIALIIIGILLAVNIDSCVTKNNNNKIRCDYLDELLFMIESDIKDVKSNIKAFEKWNPKINDVYNGLRVDSLSKVDSLYYKLGTVGNYIHFQQGSISLIEELKYSDIILIPDRKLRNEILKYQNETVAFLRNREIRYEKVGDHLRSYYLENFLGFNYGEVRPLDLEKLKKDKKYLTLVYQRLGWNNWFRSFYKNQVQKDLIKIKLLIEEKIKEDCK